MLIRVLPRLFLETRSGPSERGSLRAFIVRAAIVATSLGVCACAKQGVPFERGGVVRTTTGASPVHEGARCHVSVTNETRRDFLCRTAVVCGDVALYGGARGGGFARCTVRGGRWVQIVDDQYPGQDGDPWLRFDVATGQVEVREENQLAVIVSLSPAGRQGATE